MGQESIPLSLYIHIPWCERKCPYCDFNSHESEHIPQHDYVKALIEDMHNSQKLVNNREIHSIFFGGGTPSLFSADLIHTILQNVYQKFSVSEHCEITLEANPSSAERDKFLAYRQSGVNRLSIGAQSFQNNLLQALGRIHSSKDAILAIEKAQHSSFDNINIDLMTGLPNQNFEQAMNDLEQAVALQTQHISWYELTIEANTAFYSKPPLLPPEILTDKFDKAGKNFLTGNGFKRYEISAYCKPEYECQHNLNYWHYGDYLGLGAGAHSKISSINNNNQTTIQRFSKPKQPSGYMKSQQVVGITIIEKEDIVSDYLLNAMRLANGFNIRQCKQRSVLTHCQSASILSHFRGEPKPSDHCPVEISF